SDGPPSLDDVTTSLTCAESVDVKTFTSSGMIAPASVPHVMMAASFHQSVPSPKSEISILETTKVRATDTTDVSHTSVVNGVSKFMRVAWPYRALASASLIR